MTRTDDVEALALEISTTEGISLEHALEAARSQLRSLETFAAEWDAWTATWRATRPVAVQYA